jgi:hypothetical protein
VELSPRIFLLVQNEAKVRNESMSEAAEGLLSEVALLRAEQAVRRQVQAEGTEYRELKRRNEIERQKLRELERQAKIWEEYSRLNMMFEQGRRSVLGKQAEYQRRWRQRKKEQEVLEQKEASRGNGDGALQ